MASLRSVVVKVFTSLTFWFFVAYLAIIFFFATAYWLMPGQFYHTTVVHEASMRADSDRISKELRDSIVREYKKNHGGTSILKDKMYTASVDNLELSNLRLSHERFTFDVNLPTEPAHPNFDIISRQGTTLDVLHDYTEIIPNTRYEFDPKSERFRHAYVRKADSNVLLLDGLIGAKFVQGGGLDSMRVKIPITLDEEMKAYVDAQKGFPGKSSGSYWRMVYLSTVTITTLGYGDILPITTLARTLVALEAIIGTLIFGLYLSLLAAQLERRLRDIWGGGGG